MYKANDFVHNIRHITEKKWNEINELIIQSDFVVYHYPTYMYYNVMHLHVMPESLNHQTNFSPHRANSRDVSRRYYEITWGAVHVWFKKKYIDYSKVTVPVVSHYHNFNLSSSYEENVKNLISTMTLYSDSGCLNKDILTDKYIINKANEITSRYLDIKS